MAAARAESGSAPRYVVARSIRRRGCCRKRYVDTLSNGRLDVGSVWAINARVERFGVELDPRGEKPEIIEMTRGRGSDAFEYHGEHFNRSVLDQLQPIQNPHRRFGPGGDLKPSQADGAPRQTLFFKGVLGGVSEWKLREKFDRSRRARTVTPKIGSPCQLAS